MELGEQLTKQSGSNFYYAFLFMPKLRRQALYNVYAYCRLIDDIVDGSAPVASKAAALQGWREQLRQAFGGGHPTHPIARGLMAARARFGLRYEDALAVLEGCEMDLYKTRYASWDELSRYCYLVASAVGLLCIELFGCIDPRSRQYAIELGQALQLTNILRDVTEDATRGRIYLPLQALAEFGVSEADVLHGTRSAQVERLLREVARRARTRYVRAHAARTGVDRRALLPAEIMGNLYFALLEELERRGDAVLRPYGKPSLPTPKKVLVALSTVGQTLLPRVFSESRAAF